MIKNVASIKNCLALIVVAVLTACGSKENSAGPSQMPPQAHQEVAPTTPFIAREQPVNAAPLGIEIGYANLAGVKAKIGNDVRMINAGTNQYSGGPMLETNGVGLGVEGLSNMVMIFDQSDVLVGLIMTLPKDPKDILKKLSGKYIVVQSRIDNFMNNGYALLEKGDSLIEISAPHMSFTMDIIYLTKQLKADYRRQSSEEETAKRKEQINKL